MADDKPLCKFGGNCYRKNPQHLQNYRHPKRKHESGDDKPGNKAAKGSPPEKKHKTITDFFGGKKNFKSENGENEKADKEPKASSSKETVHQDATTEPPPDQTRSDEEVDDVEDSDEEPVLSPNNIGDNIKQKFLVEMPEDFFHFWEFCCHLDKKKPQDALSDSLGYSLVGPFDIMSGKHKGVKKNKHGRRPNYLLHWRYYYDPPEFMTVIRGDNKSQFHLGYFRDDPSSMPCMVAANSAADSCVFCSKGDNLFAAIKICIDEQLKDKSTSNSVKEELKKVQDEVVTWAKKKNYSLDLKSKKMKDRDKLVNCKTFHGAGIVVPVDDNGVGYRPVPETPGDLKKMMKAVVNSKTDKEKDEAMDAIQELITLVQFANDECDYGEGLELGLDLFCYGSEVFHPMIECLLPLAYQLLGRIEYEQISKAHLKCRQKGSDLSQLE